MFAKQLGENWYHAYINISYPSIAWYSFSLLLILLDPADSDHWLVTRDVTTHHDPWWHVTMQYIQRPVIILSLTCPQTLQTRPCVTLGHLSAPDSSGGCNLFATSQDFDAFLGCRCHCHCLIMEDVFINNNNYLHSKYFADISFVKHKSFVEHVVTYFLYV